MEQGKIQEFADSARLLSKYFRPYIERGYDVVSIVPSCTLMMKNEWKSILPDDDVCQFVGHLSKLIFIVGR